MMKYRFGWFSSLILLTFVCPGLGDEAKYHDKDLIQDEAHVPAYDLPRVLVSAEGKPIATSEEWFQIRRPQIIGLFGNLVYGTVPLPESPVKVSHEVVKTDREFFGGEATRKDVRIRFENEKGKAEMTVLVFSPNGATKPVPAILVLSFDSTRGDSFNVDTNRPGRLRNGWPIGEFVKRGIGLVVVNQGALAAHNEVDFQNSIHHLFFRAGQSFPKDYEWGVISAISWSASRALDYLGSDPDIDAKRVAILGHSKCGKAALWAAAQDRRFAMAISANSGHPGAALDRRKFGETLDKMVTRFPYWLCRNAAKFAHDEDALPVDQHMLLACIAPRPLYVMSSVDDLWADPRGEYLSAWHASEVYRLLGKKGLESETSPAPGQPILQSDVGYHIREGGHSIELYDWMRFLEFTEIHLKAK